MGRTKGGLSDMIRDVVSALDYSLCAEISLVLFAGVFLAICWKTMRSQSTWMDHCAAIPLEDSDQEKKR